MQIVNTASIHGANQLPPEGLLLPPCALSLVRIAAYQRPSKYLPDWAILIIRALPGLCQVAFVILPHGHLAKFGQGKCLYEGGVNACPTCAPPAWSTFRAAHSSPKGAAVRCSYTCPQVLLPTSARTFDSCGHGLGCLD